MTVAQTVAGSLPIPSLFNEENAAKWGYRPDVSKVFIEAHAWQKRHGVKAATKDGKKVHLLGIDQQQDFCLPEGTLYVAGRSGRGAIDDSARAAAFIYKNLGTITRITATLDTHLAFQIFFQSFWQKADGSSVDPHTIITVADLDRGAYHVAPQAAAALKLDYGWLTKYVNHYCAELERTGKYQLYIWPFHCLLGTEGHALVGVLQEAMFFHAFARGMVFVPEIKGGNPLTENYSVLRAEVLSSHDGRSIAQRNVKFLESLVADDRIIIDGQAASHCDKATIEDLLAEIAKRDASLARKVYIVRDLMSAVVVPGVVDYTQQAEDALDAFAKAGMHVVKSTDPIDSWPDF